jgi:hypothetical protein
MGILVLSCSDQEEVKLPDMTRNYSKRSKKPFGSYTAFRMLQHKYDENGIETLTKPFYENWRYNLSTNNKLYIVVSRRMLLSENDREAMLQFVENGNHVFVASEYIDNELLDTLGVDAQYFAVTSMFQEKADTSGPMHFTTVSVRHQDTSIHKKYGFFYFPLDARFISPDKIGATTLGLNEESAPNYISLVHGKGRFFFHLNPEAFSNYFLLQNDNKAYLEEVFSFMSPQKTAVYWDDYYRIGQQPNENFSSFAVFLKYPMLKWALLAAITLLILYISFASKRRQRPVPIRVANNNASKSFVDTIGRLYLQKKDNLNIAHKMTTYFLEHIRSRYYLNTSNLNAEFFSSLSRKSGVNEAEVKRFFQFIQQLQESHAVSDEELLEYNERMQSFFK